MSVWEIIGIFLMPVTYGFVGWLTNSAALYMTLYPLEFVGLRPYFGWQGIVPRRAKAVSLTAIKLLTTRVVRVEEFFGRIKARQLERMYAPVLDAVVRDLVRRELDARQLAAGEADSIASAALERTQGALGELAARLETDGGHGAFNFRGLVLRRTTGPNARHLVHIFSTIGAKEFRLVRRGGWVFGGLLGALQSGLWLLFPQWWTLPIQGAFVGGITNVLALWMIFRPLHERRVLGFRFQGLFLRRQAEVSDQYAKLFTELVLSPRAIVEEVLHRPMARYVVDAVHRSIEESTGTQAPEGARSTAISGLVEQFADNSHVLERLVARAMNVRELIAERMKEMPPEEFEPILRSAFRQDEYLLILIGAVFGSLIGLVQGLFMLQF